MDKLKDGLNGEIMEALKISYDGLDENEKNIFLDIACFFKGKCKCEVVQILDSCGFRSVIGLDVLIEKSLLTISHFHTTGCTCMICYNKWVETLLVSSLKNLVNIVGCGFLRTSFMSWSIRR